MHTALHSELEEFLGRREHDIITAAKANDLAGIRAALNDDPTCINVVYSRTQETAAHIVARHGFYKAAIVLLGSPLLNLEAKDMHGLDVRAAAVEGGHEGIICEVIWTQRPELRPEPGPDGKISYEPTPD